MSRIIQRGQLIVFEGIDRCGKSTQCQNLKRAFEKEGKKAIIQMFPDRETPSGSMIDSYLKKKADYCDEFIHLLFSANRWECIQKLKSALLSGTTVIVDRYAFSGVAYSSAKGTLSFKWCQAPDIGLIKPDCVFFLNIDPLIASQRANAGKERYEILEFQQKVLEQFMKMKDDTWKVIDANQSEEKVLADIYNHALSLNNEMLTKLWSTDS
ncbi:thymidylate kinase-like [Argonauta hians]